MHRIVTYIYLNKYDLRNVTKSNVNYVLYIVYTDDI